MNSKKAFILALGILPSAFLSAQTIVDYTFDNTETRPAPEVGSSISSISSTLASITGYQAWATGTEQGTDAVVISGASGPGRFIDISLDATGFQDITLGSFFQLSATNTTAAVNWQLSYSLNGGTDFTQIGSDFSIINVGGGNSENSQITTGADFTLPDGANNISSIIFRLNSAPGSLDFNGATASGGQIRFDNFTISGTSIPEPSSLALISGFIALACVMIRRR